MKNIVIFTDSDCSNLEALFSKNEEYDVRTKNIDEIKDALKYNPSLIVLKCVEQKLKEVSMVTKLPCPALIISEKFIDDILFRGDSYDFVRSDNSGTRIKTAYVFDLNEEYGFAVQLDFHYDSSGFLYFMPYEAKESESSDSIAVKNVEFTIHLRDFITRSTSLVHADYLDYLEVKV